MHELKFELNPVELVLRSVIFRQCLASICRNIVRPLLVWIIKKSTKPQLRPGWRQVASCTWLCTAFYSVGVIFKLFSVFRMDGLWKKVWKCVEM
jgi:hypothetical protein